MGWIRRYVVHHGKRHPAEMGAVEVADFLGSLAIAGRVSASTQNQAFSALLFLYREVLGRALELPEVPRAKGPVRLPLVLSPEEVSAILRHLHGTPWLMASLLYGAGLRLLECARLRIKDVDFDGARSPSATARAARTVSPCSRVRLVAALAGAPRPHAPQHQSDLQGGAGSVALPHALARKYPAAQREWCWQWVFPATRCSLRPPERHSSPPPSSRVRPAACLQGRRACRWPREAGNLPHAAALFRFPPAGGWLRHPHHPGVAGAQRRGHDHGLHARTESRWPWRSQPARPDPLSRRRCSHRHE